MHFSYQPSYDPYHTAFRVLRVRDIADGLEYEKCRILDFFLLFPFRLHDFRFKPEDRALRQLAKEYSSTRGYAVQPPPRQLFTTMSQFYSAATQTLAANGYVDIAALSLGLVTYTGQPIPESLDIRTRADNAAEADLLTGLRRLSTYDLLGRNGLKDRSGLLEYRNDAA